MRALMNSKRSVNERSRAVTRHRALILAHSSVRLVFRFVYVVMCVYIYMHLREHASVCISTPARACFTFSFNRVSLSFSSRAPLLVLLMHDRAYILSPQPHRLSRCLLRFSLVLSSSLSYAYFAGFCIFVNYFN